MKLRLQYNGGFTEVIGHFKDFWNFLDIKFEAQIFHIKKKNKNKPGLAKLEVSDVIEK